MLHMYTWTDYLRGTSGGTPRPSSLIFSAKLDRSRLPGTLAHVLLPAIPRVPPETALVLKVEDAVSGCTKP